MRPPNSQRSVNASPRSITRQILVSPWIGILRKVGFLPKTSEVQAISEVVLFTLIVALFTCFIGYQLSSNSEISKAWEVLISLALVVCGYDMAKEFIGSTVQAVSAQSFQDGKNEGLKELTQKITEINEQYKGKIEESIQEQQHRYYLSWLVNRLLTISDLKLVDISHNIHQEMHRIGTDSFQKQLKKEFGKIREERAIRCIVQKLPDEKFLEPIALSSAMQALGKSSREKEEKEAMNRFPEYYLYRDIYAYLKAWLICSIDNDSGNLMPISPIGLNYPDKDNPNKEVYIAALTYIKDDLLEREEAKEFLSETAKQKVKECIGKLIELIEEYQYSEPSVT